MTASILSQLAPLTQAPSQPKSTARAEPNSPADKAARAAEEFEAIYLSLMFSNMFTSLGDGPFSGGPGEDIYRSQLHEEMGRIFARSGGIGIADAVQREIMRHQEV